MNGLRLYLGNRLESLLDELSSVIVTPLSSPLVAETIVVQSIGMSRWLTLELAKRHGICANIDFPFPHAFFQTTFEQLLGKPHEQRRYEPQHLAWRIMHTLPSLIANAEFQPLRRYLRGEQPELRRYQLAKKIAAIFDEYLVFRPDWILSWDAGREDHWQAQLWRAISHGAENDHLPAMARQFIASLTANSPARTLPERISIFGISTLSKFYLDLFEALAKRTELHLFLMQPTPHEWTEIRSQREELRELRKHRELSADDLHIERGNPLLASLGKSGRAFASHVIDLEVADTREVFAEPHGDSILAQVQRDIYELNDPLKKMAVSENLDSEKIHAANHDHSIQFHSCHSAMREIEVLYDQLLALFERDPALKPRDILVVTPDVHACAPFIEAVFGVPEDESMRIPFSVADRSLCAESGAIDAFFKLLDLAGLRLAVSVVLPLLELACVREKFAISEAELETIRAWIKATKIRWGRDAAHRAQFGVPAFAQNSWRAGIDRMLLGYALRGGNEKLFADILPFDEIEGVAAETLGKFVALLETLFTTLEKLEQPHSIKDWCALLRMMVSEFFAPTEHTERDLLQLRKAFDALEAAQHWSEFEGAVGIEIVHAHLADAVEGAARQRGFLEGKVTFAALKPMRSIPFKVICMIGMNDGCFPRNSGTTELNRMTKFPRLGDRSVRDDDRYLFLELLLSTRAVFYLSYVGQSLNDNRALPPSVVVSELRDYLAASVGEAFVKRLETIHPLQPFSARYFSDEKLRSYSRENFDASRALQMRRAHAPLWCAEPLGEPDPELRNVSVADLIRFFKNPTQYFLQTRLGITLRKDDEQWQDDEPFALHKFDEYRWKQSLTANALRSSPLADSGAILRASGDLPPEASGLPAANAVQNRARDFAMRVRKTMHGDGLPPLEIDERFGAFTVSGVVDGIYAESGLVQFRCASLKARDVLAFWISLLAANSAGAKIGGVLIAEDKCLRIKPPLDARAILSSLLAMYWSGLQSPLAFFPESSLAYVETLQTQDVKKPLTDAELEKKAIGAAKKIWEKPARKYENAPPAESENIYFMLAFRNVENPLDTAWAGNSKAIFETWFNHAEEEKR